MGLPGFFGRRPSKTLDRGPGPSIVTVPTPVYATAADQNRAARLKMASPSILKTAFGRGDIPWYYPGMAVAGLGGAAGGYGLMSHIMNSKAKSDLQSEEEVARQEYQKAMLEQYDPKLLPTADRVPLSTLPKVQKELSTAPAMPALKMASAGTMDNLDALAETYEKQALPGTGLLGGAAKAINGLGIKPVVGVPSPPHMAEPLPPGVTIPGSISKVGDPWPERQTPANIPHATQPNSLSSFGGGSAQIQPPSDGGIRTPPLGGMMHPPMWGVSHVNPDYVNPNAHSFGDDAFPHGRSSDRFGGGLDGFIGSAGVRFPAARNNGPFGVLGRPEAVEPPPPVQTPALQKKAFDLPEMPSAGKMLGMYGAYAVPAAGLSAALAYNHFKDRGPDALLRNAIKERERQRWASRPPEIYAVPQPVHVQGGQLSEAPEKMPPILGQLGLTTGAEKAAFADTALLGALIGASQAPKNNAWRGAGRGAALGAGTGVGAMLGVPIGVLAGGLAGGAMDRYASPDPAIPGLGAAAGMGMGGLAGLLGGGYGAYKLLKKPVWNRPWKPAETKEEHSGEEKAAGIVDGLAKPVLKGLLGGGKAVGRGAAGLASTIKANPAPSLAVGSTLGTLGYGSRLLNQSDPIPPSRGRDVGYTPAEFWGAPGGVQSAIRHDFGMARNALRGVAGQPPLPNPTPTEDHVTAWAARPKPAQPILQGGTGNPPTGGDVQTGESMFSEAVKGIPALLQKVKSYTSRLVPDSLRWGS